MVRDLEETIDIRNKFAKRITKEHHGIEVLNVAGPRESKQPGIQEYTRRLLVEALG